MESPVMEEFQQYLQDFHDFLEKRARHDFDNMLDDQWDRDKAGRMAVLMSEYASKMQLLKDLVVLTAEDVDHFYEVRHGK